MSRALLKRIFTDKKRINTDHGSVIRLNSFPIRVYPFACFISIAILSIFLVLPKQTHAASYITGRFGKAISFDGTGDYVDMGDVSSTVKTVDFWVSPNTTTQKFLELNGSSYIDVTSGTVGATGFTSPTIYVDGVVSSTLTTGWHHIAVTTGTGINGNSVIVGKIATTYFTGLIDSVRMYDRALSASEIAAHYSLGRGKHDNYAAKIKLAADDSNSYLDESLTSGQDYLASFWYHPGEDNTNAIRFKVSGSADPIMAEHNLMASSAMGLVGAWNFEDSLNDISGNGLNLTGTNIDSADYSSSGKFGKALDLDGSTEYTSSNSNGFDPGTNDWTVELWIKRNSTGLQLLMYNGACGPTIPGYFFGFNGTNYLYAYAANGSVNLVSNQLSASAISDTTNSHHIIWSFDRNGYSTFYIDGSANGTSVAINDSTNLTNAVDFILGAYDSGSYKINGLIDSVRIYNRALTASEVYDRYKAGDWHKYELSFEADQTGAHLFKFIQDGTTTGSSIVYVDNFRVDKNLADKGGMEGTYTSGIAPGWSGAGGPTVAESSSAHTGSKAQSITGGSTSQNVYQTISSGITSGNWYTLSVYGKTNSGNAYAELSGATAKTITISNFQFPISPSQYTFKAGSASLTIELYADATKTGTFDDISLVELDSTSIYTDPTTTTPSSEANSYTTGKWSGTEAAFLIDGADKLSYNAPGVLNTASGTIAVWWKPVWDYDKFSQNVYLFDAEDATNKFMRLFYDYNDYKFVAHLYNGANWTTVTASSTAMTLTSMPEDTWRHISVIYGNDEGTVRILVDGAEDETDSYTGAAWTEQTTPTNFYIGSLYGASANTNQADGWFDDIRIYGDSLATSTVNAIYAITPDAPTNATWKFNLADPIIDD